MPKGVDVYVWSSVSNKLHQNVDPISLGHPDAIKVDKRDAQICNINKLLHISIIAPCMPIVIKPVIAHQHSNYIIQDDLKSTLIHMIKPKKNFALNSNEKKSFNGLICDANEIATSRIKVSKNKQ